MRAVGGVFVPLILTICLPILQSQATAAETGRSGDEAWTIAIEPGVSNAGLLKRLALQDTDAGQAVPSPVEPGDTPPADEFALPEVVPGNVQQSEATTGGEGTGIAITPGNAAGADAEADAAATPAKVNPASYWAIYESIPFLRSAYDANPAYRHDATMELLTGNARPSVIHHHDAASCAPYGPAAGAIPPYITDIYLGQIPTFVQRYLPPAIPFGYPLVW
jgi:hypothetical protein